ncbi:S1 RNA-binding domain-containing protein [Sporomusa sphaeroides]|uniref:S1 RNA-binding domain-containing protein n=1 Tax=Sporomusa sphaeroides TaxID=47679 RepID=UPI002BE57AD9|nr:S1 RNA-binding domain-containing protein [Sporomusa sphaeroides]HML33405.1 S1 RNA-binding domain-containing protein [Sporomusa sphaeroides]
MTKKKTEMAAMLPEPHDAMVASEEEAEVSAAQQGGDIPDGEDLNELLAAMDKAPDDEGLSPEDDTPTSDNDDPGAGDDGFASGSAELEPPAEDAPPPAEGDFHAEPEPPKPKRAPRKKKAETDSPAEKAPEPPAGDVSEPGASNPTAAVVQPAPPVKRATRRKAAAPILTIEAHTEAETQESIEDTIWHEIHNAYRTRKILTGYLGGIEQTDTGKTLVIVEYKGFRIIIPMKEMMINLGRSPSGAEYDDLVRRQNKILGTMLGAEIDFLVKGIDSKTRSAVGSRKEAMLKKRQIFYLNTDAAGMYRIYEGRIVQARVIAVAEKVVRVEVFGVECSILARDLAWDWIGDAHERFSVGDQILVRILSVKREGLEDISITADAKSVSEDQTHENLKKCRVQSKYSGKVTDVRRGVVYVRLTNGVNGVAHSCYDRRLPGKKDDVSFAVTRIDEERGVAVGIITRIIKQHL